MKQDLKFATLAAALGALAAALVVFLAVAARAQTCIVPAPSSPPRPVELSVRFTNPDGGARPCAGLGLVPGGATPKPYPLSNAKCDQAMAIAEQAAAIDNGWNDGGTP